MVVHFGAKTWFPIRGVLPAGRFRNQHQLNTMSSDVMRNTLIVELDGQTHLGASLQGLTNIDLVKVALGIVPV